MLKLATSIWICFFILRAFDAAAAPEYSAPLPKLEPPEKAERPLDDNLSVSPPPQVISVPKGSARYFPYHEALALRLGLAGTDLRHESTLYGFDYMFPSFLSPHWEFGAEYSEATYGHIHGGMRWTFNQRGFFRPSLKFELDNRLSSSEGLAGFVSIDQYYLRGTATLDYTFWDPVSLRLEINVLGGIKDAEFAESLGLTYAW